MLRTLGRGIVLNTYRKTPPKQQCHFLQASSRIEHPAAIVPRVDIVHRLPKISGDERFKKVPYIAKDHSSVALCSAFKTMECFIAHDPATGDVNLLQVAHFIKQNHARMHVESTLKKLGLPSRRDKKIGGVGKDVVPGTYDEAVSIARYLGASDEQLDAIKQAIAAVDGTGEISVPESLDLDKDFSTIMTYVSSENAFPVPFDEVTAGWLEYSSFGKAVRALEVALDHPELKNHAELRVVADRLGRKRKYYFLTVEGIKRFGMMAQTRGGQKVREAFLQIEMEYNKIVTKDVAQEVHNVAWEAAKAIPKRPHAVKEALVRDRLAKALGAKTEVACKFGKVDIVTDTHIIEVKRVHAYKHAIGQVLVYKQAKRFQNKRMQVHLFGKESKMNVFTNARRACKELNIEVSFEFID